MLNMPCIRTGQEQEICEVRECCSIDITESLLYDIGEIIRNVEKEKDLSIRFKSLSAATKYQLLKNHSHPVEGDELPKTYTGGCNRSFKTEWLKQYKWLCFSKKVDGAFCLPCSVFNGHSDSGIFGALITKPFRKWQKKTEKFSDHEKAISPDFIAAC